MELRFANRKLERQLSDSKAMRRAYGERTKRIQMRLDLLRAARSLADVPIGPPPRRHESSADWAGHFAVDVTGNWRLIFRPAHDPIPRSVDGGIDLNRVTAVEIVAILDYHGK